MYTQKCQSCHGEHGAGKPNDPLVGGQGTLTSPSPVRTIGSYWPYATTVFDYVRRAMPYTQSHSLTNEEVYAVTAYLLHLNGIIGAQDVMNAQTLPQVQMPNRNKFLVVYPTKAAVNVEHCTGRQPVVPDLGTPQNRRRDDTMMKLQRLLGFVVCGWLSWTGTVHADAVTDWNAIAVQALATAAPARPDPRRIPGFGHRPGRRA